MIYDGEDTITIPYAIDLQYCDVITIISDGKMPNNTIWISIKEPRHIIKIYVPDQKLSIELVR